MESQFAKHPFPAEMTVAEELLTEVVNSTNAVPQLPISANGIGNRTPCHVAHVVAAEGRPDVNVQSEPCLSAFAKVSKPHG